MVDLDHETFEYAVLVPEKWQNNKLGSQLTDFCMDIAEHWHLQKVVAQSSTDNQCMISVFRKHGFTVKTDLTCDVVDVEKVL